MSLVKINNSYPKDRRLTRGMTDKNVAHSYLPLYDTLLEPIKNTATNIFELGVNRGGSIRLWHEYFTKATIYACDIIDNVQSRTQRVIRATSDEVDKHLNYFK